MSVTVRGPNYRTPSFNEEIKEGKEVGLVEYLNVFFRHILLIILGTLSSGVGGLCWMLFHTPRVYKAETAIAIVSVPPTTKEGEDGKRVVVPISKGEYANRVVDLEIGLSVLHKPFQVKEKEVILDDLLPGRQADKWMWLVREGVDVTSENSVIFIQISLPSDLGLEADEMKQLVASIANEFPRQLELRGVETMVLDPAKPPLGLVRPEPQTRKMIITFLVGFILSVFLAFFVQFIENEKAEGRLLETRAIWEDHKASLNRLFRRQERR